MRPHHPLLRIRNPTSTYVYAQTAALYPSLFARSASGCAIQVERAVRTGDGCLSTCTIGLQTNKAIECKESAACAPAKHHFDECVERVTAAIDENGKADEDCVEECTSLFQFPNVLYPGLELRDVEPCLLGRGGLAMDRLVLPVDRCWIFY